jgi:glyoxylase-like metal-dependent hydrolase (beta-lactamase superfamily II)
MIRKLHAFHCGFERFPNALFDPFSPAPGAEREIPYFFYLLEHANGLVLFDTGVHPNLIADIKSHLGPEADNWGIEAHPADDARAKLAALGIAPGEISHLVMSHLHYDHAGGIMSFPNAQVWMQRAEWDFANAPPVYQDGLYIKSEFAIPRTRLHLIEGAHDLFGDGAIRMIPTPGHTPGHQSLLARGEHAYILTADAAYEPDLADVTRLPAAALCVSPDDMIASREKLRALRDEYDATVLCTHDINFRANVRRAPAAHYD